MYTSKTNLIVLVRSMFKMNPGTLQTMCQLVIVVCVIVGALATYGSFYFGQKIKDEATAKTATEGIVSNVKIADERNLAIGGIRIVLTGSNDIIVTDGNSPLLSLEIDNGKLLVSANIYDETGKIVAILEENQWQVNKNNYFDRNYNDTAIEVKNQKGRVVLQVVNFGDVVHFAGVFHTKDGHVVSMLPSGESSSAIEIRGSERELTLDINSIFEYPSESNFGSCPGKDDLENIVMQGKYHFYFSGSIDVGNYIKDMDKIIILAGEFNTTDK